MLSRVVENTSICNLNKRDLLREVTVKIGLERIDMQERITVEVLLDSGATGLVMSSEFTRKQRFKLKKLDRPMYVRNVDSLLNKEEPIEHTVEVNIYYQEHRERTEIDVIRGQKWMVILGMPWLACHNPEIDWKIGEVKMTRCPEKYGKQWRPKQGKPGWQKQKEEEAKEEVGKKREEKAEKQKKKKPKKERMMEVKRVAENRRYGTKKKRQRPRSWYWKNSISRLKSLIRNSQRGCL